MPDERSLAWLGPGEKYALVGLSAKVEQSLPIRELRSGLWAWTDIGLDVPSEWREWLGSIRTEEVESCNLVLLCKSRSARPGVLDGENQALQMQVQRFYVGLLLASTFTPAHAPILLTGGNQDGETDVRQSSTFDVPALNLFRGYPPLVPGDIERAAALAECQDRLVQSVPPGGAWRIFRAISVYVSARTRTDLLDRLHQYCRCVDALILSEPGSGRKQFKSRTELFIGPRHHDLMDSLYGIRSDVEHLNEHRYLEVFDRKQRLDLVEKEAIAEHIARCALAHVIGEPTLWPIFGNTASLEQFWRQPQADREKLWGTPTITPADALAGYDPEWLSDADLGRR